ncbi:hypothetical protein [Chitinophaga nivalis]|uniref:Uncharacterized protein n=1 Tax=Chitinophaga nivalis TaxID=2991709 RepID=A0ABT3IQD8_9BACT|nr:hypothetical protein [Chitinophaga nivalis]MCW3464128.1 hypothetical protein [Chitinophaga nivalis]MCW3486182.1 hypothetical protein [Chitinophaga nivalis]
MVHSIDIETAHYIINYYAHLMTDQEQTALKHASTSSMLQLNQSIFQDTNPAYKQKYDWISDDPAILSLLANGSDAFRISAATRILQEHHHRIFINSCPRCSQLARTIAARQCRHCGHSWHDNTLARFKLRNYFRPDNKPLFLLGEVMKGDFQKGHYIDLTMLHINAQPRIEQVEFSLHRQQDNTWENIALGISDISEEDLVLLKKVAHQDRMIDIIRQRRA